MTEIPFGRFFLPGPSDVHPDVIRAAVRPMIAHRGKAMDDIIANIAQPLKTLFRTQRPVIVGTCSATGFMEMAVRSGVRNRVLSLVGGAFAERFAHIAAACGREVVRLDVPYGKTVEPDMLRDAIKRSDVDAVSMVHSETSTGALAPLEELAKVVQEFDDIMLLVDTVSSMGGVPVETDQWKLDFVFTGSQKALAVPPGLALAAASPRMIERAKTIPERGAYLDMVTFHEAFSSGQPGPNTPAVSLFFQLEHQLGRIMAEGIDVRCARHKSLLEACERWVEAKGKELGLSYLPDPGRRSWTVSCLKLPEGVTSKSVTQPLAQQGWTIGTGYGKLKETTIRIGHMGEHTVGALEELLGLIERVLD
ncbi:MAG: alanine--glyoxylate aminotransferase family protein [Gemmatimonadetes bacterium]|nr:alanine--glyoxylate aminotransferase family protein [Gemmatimonadota bacterium]